MDTIKFCRHGVTYLVFAVALMLSIPSQAADIPAGGNAEHAVIVAAAQGSNPATETAAVFDLDYAEEDDEEPAITIADPLQPWNTVWYHFNDKLYFWALKPAAQGYKAVVPTVARTGVSNFFRNLGAPIRFVNCVLQLKVDNALDEFTIFFANSTLGIGGLFDLHAEDPQRPSPEDFGQSLGHYGVGNGFYLVWPIFGPSSARDTVGLVGDFFLDPVSYVDGFGTRVAIKTFDTVNQTSFRLGDYEALKEAALDPYVSIRDAYIQHRAKKVEE